jgi:hypothetical protein
MFFKEKLSHIIITNKIVLMISSAFETYFLCFEEEGVMSIIRHPLRRLITKKTIYMFISCDQNARKNRNIKAAKKSLKNVAKLKYFRMVLTNQNCIHEETESRLNPSIPSYHSVENLCSSHFPY